MLTVTLMLPFFSTCECEDICDTVLSFDGPVFLASPLHMQITGRNSANLCHLVAVNGGNQLPYKFWESYPGNNWSPTLKLCTFGGSFRQLQDLIPNMFVTKCDIDSQSGLETTEGLLQHFEKIHEFWSTNS